MPTLKDGDFYINESRAAAIYLVEKYSKEKLLYPNDVKIRTLINQRLFFDIGTFYKSCIGDIVVCIFMCKFQISKFEIEIMIIIIIN